MVEAYQNWWSQIDNYQLPPPPPPPPPPEEPPLNPEPPLELDEEGL